MKNRKKLMIGTVLFLLLLAMVIIAPYPNSGSSNGISSQSGSCGPCHGSSPDTSVTVQISGIPTSYTPGQKYTLTITVSGGPAGTKGGFGLSVDKGAFSNPSANAKLSGDKEVIHSNPNARTWTVDWTAPSSGSGAVTFNVAGIATDGDGTISGDKWNTAMYSSSEESGAPLNKTIMTLDLPRKANKSETIIITATIVDEDGNPLERLTIEFYRITTFGMVSIGENVTDSQGRASVIHTISYTPPNSTVQIEAVFSGTSNFKANHTTAIIMVESEESSTIPIDIGFISIITVIILAVGSLWSVYVYVFYQLSQIRKKGKQINHTGDKNEEDG